MPSVSFQPDDMIWKMLAHADLSSMPEADLLANVADICAFYPGRVDVSLTDGRIPMRIAMAEFKQESNTFSPIAGDWFHFKDCGYWLEGDQILSGLKGSDTEAGGALEVAERTPGIELLPILATSAGASAGPVKQDVFATVLSYITDALNNLGALDGLLLCLHGAMVAEEADDATGEILKSVRAITAPEMPLAVTLDLHANVTHQVAALANIIVGYQTIPHTDMKRTGAHAMQLLIDAIAHRITPVVSLCRLPMILPSERCTTTGDPFAGIMQQAQRLEDGRALSASVFPVQPWLDIPDVGCSIIVVTDGAGALGRSEAHRIGGMFWKCRRQLIPAKLRPPQAIQLALASDERPFVFSDGSDAPSAGSTGDGVDILRTLLEMGFDDLALVNVVDAEAVHQAQEAGVGETISVLVGGKLAPRIHTPVRLTATVKAICDGEFTHQGPGFHGVTFKRGTTVVLQSRSISLVVSERPTIQWEPEFYRSLGLEPREAKIVVVKSPGGFRAAYEPISAGIVEVETPGISCSDLTALPWERIGRPIYPLDDLTEWAQP